MILQVARSSTIPEPRHPCCRTCSSRKSLALFQVASTWATQAVQQVKKLWITTGTHIHPICIWPIRHPWMRPAGPMGVGNLGDRLQIMDEHGCPTKTCCWLLPVCFFSPATFPKSAVSMHRGSIKLKGSGSVSLFPDCQDLSTRKDDVRKDRPLVFGDTVREVIRSVATFCRAPLEIAHHISYNAFLACDGLYETSKTTLMILVSLDHCKEIMFMECWNLTVWWCFMAYKCCVCVSADSIQ